MKHKNFTLGVFVREGYMSGVFVLEPFFDYICGKLSIEICQILQMRMRFTIFVDFL